MKKTYKKPLSEVVKVNAEQLICVSDQVGTGSNYSGGGIQSKGDEDYGDLW